MFAELRNRFRMRASATSELATIKDGKRSKFAGCARAISAPLAAPITGRPCVFFAVTIGEWFNGTKTPLLSETSSSQFLLEDDTGSVVVTPDVVETLLKTRRLRGHSSESHKQHKLLLARHGFSMVDEYGELRSLAFEELIIAENDAICVLGSMRTTSDPVGHSAYRTQPTKTTLGADRSGPLVLGDHP